MPAISISKLIVGATTALHELGYADRVIEYTVATWRDFEQFCNEHNFTTYNSDVKEKFIVKIQACDPPLKHETIQRKISCMKKLDAFAAKNSWEKGIVLQKPVLPVCFNEFLNAQDDLLIKKDYSKRTRETVQIFSVKFMLFLMEKGILSLFEIRAEHISDFLLTFSGYARSTLRGELSRLRQFLKRLYLLGYADIDLSGCVPQYHLGTSDSLVKIWESDEISKVLEVVDVSNPRGKRDNAIIVIAIQLGMRTADILNIKLSDFDWETGSMYFSQSKNGKPNALPLNEIVGNAIIDYLRVRPETASEHLFVNFNPPYEKMIRFAPSFLRYFNRANIEAPKDAHHGMHSLRATAATKLLAANISPDIIFPFLGHADREALGHYIRLDIESLRECALSFKNGELI
ncbi:MAG TPA: integrase [Ruminiclostridium sp.]|nr:integrase [Ruminiclostridium sp.]